MNMIVEVIVNWNSGCGEMPVNGIIFYNFLVTHTSLLKLVKIFLKFI